LNTRTIDEIVNDGNYFAWAIGHIRATGAGRGHEHDKRIEETHVQHPVIQSIEKAALAREPNPDSGEQLLNDIFDLISERLPRLPREDPARPALARLCPMLAEALERPRVAEARATRPRA
jgi:hypothetical protein